MEKVLSEIEGLAIQNFFVPLLKVPKRLTEITSSWHRLATELNYIGGPIAWRVKSGFTLKAYAPKAGPCYKNFQYLQRWNMQNDEPTKDSIVFWIPRVVAKNEIAKDQITILAKLRQKFDLPDHHLISFGSVALNSGLILEHFRRVEGERVPLNGDWIRTDTFFADGNRLNLGDFDASGLYCSYWFWDDDRHPLLGCFPLGVELGS